MATHMMHFSRQARRGTPRASYLYAVVAALALAVAGTEAQTPADSRPDVVPLQRGREFAGELRHLPDGVPPEHERGPRGEEPLLPRGNGHDQAAQTSAPAAPAPSPGSGG